ncbi:putative metal homeostasis protein [Globicatella sulfidifaciens]
MKLNVSSAYRYLESPNRKIRKRALAIIKQSKKQRKAS